MAYEDRSAVGHPSHEAAIYYTNDGATWMRGATYHDRAMGRTAFENRKQVAHHNRAMVLVVNADEVEWPLHLPADEIAEYETLAAHGTEGR
jgi:hypothetical protein